MQTPFGMSYMLPLLPSKNVAAGDGGSGAFNLFETCVFAPICLWSILCILVATPTIRL